MYSFFRYGDIFFLDSAIIDGVYVSDYEMMKDMLSSDKFTARVNPDLVGSGDIFRELKGGHGCHGVIGSMGEEKSRKNCGVTLGSIQHSPQGRLHR
jgi:hypothetical protein